MLELVQNGDQFSFLESKRIQQFSSGVIVHVQYDSYDDRIVTWRYSSDVTMQNANILEYDSIENIISMPYEMFKTINDKRTAYIQCKAVKDDEILHSNVIKIRVTESIEDCPFIDPTQPDAIQVIVDIVNQQYNQQIIPHIDQITTEAKAARDDAKKSADSARDTLSDVEQLAKQKSLEITSLGDSKKSEISELASQKTTAFNANAVSKTTEFDDHIKVITETFDGQQELIDSKVSDFVDLAASEEKELTDLSAQKQTDLTAKAKTLTDAFNSNATSKTTTFDTHVQAKETASLKALSDAEIKALKGYNDNHTSKLAIVQTVADKVADDGVKVANTEASLKASLDKVDTNADVILELDNIKVNQPFIQTQFAENLYIKDSDDGYLKNALICGNTVQRAAPSIDNPAPMQDINDIEVVSCGKNLCAVSTKSAVTSVTVSNGVSIIGKGYNQNDKKIIVNGSITVSYDTKINVTEYGATPNFNMRVDYVNSNGTYGVANIAAINCDKSIFNYDTHVSKTFRDIKQIVSIYAQHNLMAGTVEMTNIQVEVGETETPFEDYKESRTILHLDEPLRSLPIDGENTGRPVVRDYIDLEKMEIVRTVSKYIIDDKAKYTVEVKPTVKELSVEIRELGISTGETYVPFCDKAPCQTLASISQAYRYIFLKFAKDFFPNDITKEAMKSWLINNPITVYVKSGLELRSPLPQIDKLKSFNSITNVYGIAKDGQSIPILKADYKQNVDNWYKGLREQHPDPIAAKALSDAETAQFTADTSFTGMQVNTTEINRIKEKSFGIAALNQAGGHGVVLSDSADYWIKDMEMYGETRQGSTTGAQLFDASKILTKMDGGATVTDNSDGSYTVSGSGNLTKTHQNIFLLYRTEILKLLKKGNLTLKTEKNTNPYFYFAMCKISDGKEQVLMEINSLMSPKATREIKDEWLQEETLYARLGFYGVTGNEIIPGTIKPMLYQNGDGTWEPYTGGKPSPSIEYPQEMVSKVVSEIRVTGAQMYDTKYVAISTANGLTFTHNADGTITINGTSTGTVDIRFFNNLINRPLMDEINRNNGKYFLTSDFGNTHYFGTNNGYFTNFVNITDDTKISEGGGIFVRINAGITFNNKKGKIMLNKGDKALSWEPYREQKVILSQPITLRGIPVTSGGNVTIDGQQYISDTIENRDGIICHVERTIEKVFDEYSDVRTNGNPWIVNGIFTSSIPFTGAKSKNPQPYNALCDKYIMGSVPELMTVAYRNLYLKIPISDLNGDASTLDDVKKWMGNNPLKVITEREFPIITPLPLIDQQAIKDLQTYNPNTNISTNDPTWLHVDYTVDQTAANKKIVARLEALESEAVNNV